MPRPRSLAALPEAHPLVLIPVVLSAWVFHPITRTFFFADDFVHLTDLVNEGPLVFLLRPFGGNAFLVRNLVFLGSFRAFGMDPVAFQWTVLLTHLLNVVLLFGLLRAMTASAWLACLGAAVWGASPLAVASLNWYSAFGHVLVGTALLLALRGVVHTDLAGGPIPMRAAATWFVLLLIGSTCYGPGIGAALVFPVALVLLLPAVLRQKGVALAFLLLPPTTLALYYGLQYLYTLVGQLSIEEAVHQKAALSGFERIPVLWAHLLAYSSAGALLGFFMPKGFPQVAAWSVLAGLGLALAMLLWRGSATTRRMALAMVVLWAGIYLMIASGRAHLYTLLRVSADTAATVGRYHYAGTIPLIVLVCLALQQIARIPGLRAVPRGLAVAVLLGVFLSGRFVMGFPIDQHPLVHDYFLYTQQDVAADIAAAPQGKTVYLENEETPNYVLGVAIPSRMFPGRAGVFLLSGPAMHSDGREVRFIERNPETLMSYRQRADTPLARLLVAPEEIPGSP